MDETEHIPVSWVSVHHRPGHANTSSLRKRRMMSLDDELLSDVQNRMSLYDFEVYDIDEEDDDVFMDTVESIVHEHRRVRQRHRDSSRTSSTPSFHESYVSSSRADGAHALSPPLPSLSPLIHLFPPRCPTPAVAECVRSFAISDSRRSGD